MTITIKANSDGLSGAIQANGNDVIKFDQSGITQGAPLSFRNKLINGNFDVWQRGTSFANPASVYTADRWNAAGTASTIALVPAYTGYGKNALSIAATNATNSGAIAQPIESSTTSTLRGKTITFSFYYSASVNQPVNSMSFFVQKNSTADSLAGTWTTFSATTLLSPTPTIQRASVTVAVPSDGTSAGLRPFISTSNITNGSSVYIFGVQLEEGEIATPFEYRPVGLEVSLCQRYYETGSAQIGGYALAGGGIYYRVPFKIQKRAVPTLTYGSLSAINVSVYDVRNPSVFDLLWFCQAATPSMCDWSGTYTASAEL